MHTAVSTALALSIDGREEGDLAAVNVAVPRMGAVNASWVLDLAPHADASGEVVLRVSASDASVGSAADDIALPLVVRLVVGHWECASAGGLSDPASAAPLCK